MALAEWKELLRLTNPVANQHRVHSRWMVVSKEIGLRILPYEMPMRLKQLPMSLKETPWEN